jgi:hypothetical protein
LIIILVIGPESEEGRAARAKYNPLKKINIGAAGKQVALIYADIESRRLIAWGSERWLLN